MFVFKVFSFFFICLLAICNNSKTQIENTSQISQPDKPELSLTVERSRCYGVCPAYKLNIQPDGKVVFEGIDFTKIKGKAEGRLSEEKILQLVTEINKADFFSLKDFYTQDSGNCPKVATDGETVKTFVKLQDKEKTVTHYIGCGNDETRKLSKLEDKINEIVETKRWIGEENERLPKINAQ